jgi:hypothetical protein
MARPMLLIDNGPLAGRRRIGAGRIPGSKSATVHQSHDAGVDRV